MKPIILDCGHEESQHSDITRGYGMDNQGKKYCYDCCVKKDIEELHETGVCMGYISSDGKTICSWPGLTLAKIEYLYRSRHGYCGTVTKYRAHLKSGHAVYGTGPGKGMYCTVRLYKRKE